MCLTLEETFTALFSVNAAIVSLGGINEWRCTFDERLREFDEEISSEVIFAPSKQIGNKESVWAYLHFSLILPTIHKISQNLPPEAQQIEMSMAKAESYFRFLPDVIGHLQEHQEWKVLEDATPVNTPIKFAEWCSQFSSNSLARFLMCFGNHISDEFLTQKITIDGFLSALPDSWDDLTSQSQESIRQKNNCFFRRMIQSYYADIQKCDYKTVGINALAKNYFQTSPDIPHLHLRLRKYWEEELLRCPLASKNDFSHISFAELFQLYGKWYQRPGVVEMISQDFTGAAENAAFRYCSFLQEAKQLLPNSSSLDIVEIPDNVKENTDLLRRFGRLAMFVDTVGNGRSLVVPLDGSAIRSVAKKIWSSGQIVAEWGNSSRYLPRENQPGFFQEIASLLLTTALTLSDHQEKVSTNPQTILELKTLAQNVKEASSYKAVSVLLHHAKDLLKIAQDKTAEIDNTHPKNFTSFGITYICHYFGVITSPGESISLEDLWLGVHIQRLENGLSITYQEAQKEIVVDVKLEKDSFTGNFTYENQSICLEGIWYPDFYQLAVADQKVIIPKIGRGGYDLLGKSGASHAGLVVGYGCSVFHNSLQLAQVVAACEGASLEALQKIKKSFFQIYPEFHHRHLLADFQTEQIWQAVHYQKSLSYLQWLQQIISAEKFEFSTGYEHSKAFLESNGAILKDYNQSVARLVTCYPDLYPPEASSTKINPRVSFYDGRCATIDAENFNPQLYYRGVLEQ